MNQMKGKKVVLRKRNADDEEDIYKWANLEDWQYLDDPSLQFRHITRREFETRTDTRFFDKRPSWHIDTMNGEHIGFVKYQILDEKSKEVEVGICLPESKNWDKGYGKEVLKLVIKHLFEEMEVKKVVLSTWEGNDRAKALYNKLGFNLSERGKIWDIKQQKQTESLIYRLTKKQYKEIKEEKYIV